MQLSVGGARVEVEEARQIVGDYVGGDAVAGYPAYDGYPGTAGPEVGLQDLFAPALLNAGVRALRTYYDLEAALPELNLRLRAVRPDLALVDATADDIRHAARVYGLLDARTMYGVGGTKLSKIVHRKRPLLLPLWDREIAWCYQLAPEAPLPRVAGRTWEVFALSWLKAVQSDLLAGHPYWQEFAQLTPNGAPAITALRAMDIVGWTLGSRHRRSTVTASSAAN